MPAYAPALGHLAEVDAALGAPTPPSSACTPWRRPATTPSTRPPSRACSATPASPLEAEQWRVSAAARYDELVSRHPEAFVDHAAEFWLTVGGDRSKGLELVVRDHASRSTRALAMLHYVILSRLVACRPRHVHTRSKGTARCIETKEQRHGRSTAAGTESGIEDGVLRHRGRHPGHEDALRQVLKEHMDNPRTQDAIDEIGTLHEARFVLLDGGKRLMFCSSFDGDWDKYIDDFATTAIGQNFDATWRHAQGYPGVRSPYQGLVHGTRGKGGQLCCRLSRADGEAGLERAGRAEGVPAGAGHPRRRRGAPTAGPQAEEVYGVRAAAPLEVVLPTLRARVERVRDVLQDVVARPARRARHRLPAGDRPARHGPHRPRHLPDGVERELAARAILLATGSRPTHPPGVPFDDPDVYDSDQIYSIRTVPEGRRHRRRRPGRRRVRHGVHRARHPGDAGQPVRSPAADALTASWPGCWPTSSSGAESGWSSAPARSRWRGWTAG